MYQIIPKYTSSRIKLKYNIFEVILVLLFILSINSIQAAGPCNACGINCTCGRYYYCVINDDCGTEICITKTGWEGNDGAGSCYIIQNCIDDCTIYKDNDQCSGCPPKCGPICSCDPCRTPCRFDCPEGGSNTCITTKCAADPNCPGAGSCNVCKGYSGDTVCSHKSCSGDCCQATTAGNCTWCSNGSTPQSCELKHCSTDGCLGTGCNDTVCPSWCANGGSQPCSGKGCRVSCGFNGCDCTDICKDATVAQCIGAAKCGCDSAPVNPQSCLPGCSVDGCCVNYSGTSCSYNCHCGCLLTGACIFNLPPSTCYFCTSSMETCSPSTCINR